MSVAVLLVATWVMSHPQGPTGAWSDVLAWSDRAGTDTSVLGGPGNIPPNEREWPTPGLEEDPTPLGTPARLEGSGAHAFTYTYTDSAGQQVPVAWSPCRPVHYAVDVTGAPSDFPARVAGVVAEMSAVTGLHFVDDGVTTEGATQRREPFQPDVYGDRWAPLLIRFTDSTTVPSLAGRVTGVGGAQSVGDRTTDLEHLVSGYVYLDLEILAKAPIDAEPAYVAVLRHEFAHALGLNHVEDPTQLMYPEPSATTFQAGDLEGLAALGRGACAPGV